MDDPTFSARIQERYPDGLTGIFAIGGTRTVYILEQNRLSNDPGHIPNFKELGEYLSLRYRQFMAMYFDLGGQNMIITATSFRSYSERGAEYATLLTKEVSRLADPQMQTFYRDHNVDPYFVGIDTLLHLPPDSPLHQLAHDLVDFQKAWPYAEGRRKVIWEIASIPLFTFWKIYRGMTEAEHAALDAELAGLTNMEEIHRRMHWHFSRAVYGTQIPMPHFYLGTNKSGDLKWRSPMPISLTGGEYMRMFYTPYPSLFMQAETLQAVLNDLAFNERFQSLKTDYSGKYSPELVEAEYNRVMNLSAQPETTVGFSRKVRLPQNT